MPPLHLKGRPKLIPPLPLAVTFRLATRVLDPRTYDDEVVRRGGPCYIEGIGVWSSYRFAVKYNVLYALISRNCKPELWIYYEIQFVLSIYFRNLPA